MISKTSTGFELIGEDLRVAVTRVFLNRLRVVKHGSIEGFTSLDVEQQRQRLAALVRGQRIPVSRVFLSLPHERGMVRQVELPVEAINEVSQAVRLQLESWIPWSSDEVYWDCAYKRPPKGVRSVTVSIAIIPREMLDPWIQLFVSAGIQLSGACLSPMAGAHAATTLWPGSPTIMLRCEPGAVDGVFVDGRRMIAVRNEGEETAQSAQDSMRQLAALGRLDSVEGIRLLVDGTASESLPSENVRLPLEQDAAAGTAAFGSIATALVGLGRSGFQTNLLPEDVRHRQGWVRWVPTYVLLTLILAVGIGLVLQDEYHDAVYASRIGEEIDRLASELGDTGDMEDELAALNARCQAAVGHIEGRDANLEVLLELARSLPMTAFLSRYSYQDGTVTISGYSESPPELQRLLENSPVFRTVEFTSPLVRDDSGKDRFVIQTGIEAIP